MTKEASFSIGLDSLTNKSESREEKRLIVYIRYMLAVGKRGGGKRKERGMREEGEGGKEGGKRRKKKKKGGRKDGRKREREGRREEGR